MNLYLPGFNEPLINSEIQSGTRMRQHFSIGQLLDNGVYKSQMFYVAASE